LRSLDWRRRHGRFRGAAQLRLDPLLEIRELLVERGNHIRRLRGILDFDDHAHQRRRVCPHLISQVKEER
jgi:hypothetical protein